MEPAAQEEVKKSEAKRMHRREYVQNMVSQLSCRKCASGNSGVLRGFIHAEIKRATLERKGRLSAL